MGANFADYCVRIFTFSANNYLIWIYSHWILIKPLSLPFEMSSYLNLIDCIGVLYHGSKDFC